MEKIPVTFNYDGQTFHSFFEQPNGVGSNVWFLTVNKRHRGQLLYDAKEDMWFFYNYHDTMKEYGDYFGSVSLTGFNEEACTYNLLDSILNIRLCHWDYVHFLVEIQEGDI